MKRINQKSIAFPVFVSLTAISLIMLLAGYFINSSELEDALEKREISKLNSVAKFVETRIDSKVEKLTIISELLRYNKAVQGALGAYTAGVHGTSGDVFEALYRRLDVDILLFVNADGVLLNGYIQSGRINDGRFLLDVWGIQEALDGVDITVVTQVYGRWSILSISPVFAEEKLVGLVMAGYLINDAFASRLSMETGAIITMATSLGVVATSVMNRQDLKIEKKLMESAFKEDVRVITSHVHENDYYSIYFPYRVVDETFCLIVQTDSYDTIVLLDKKRYQIALYSLGAFVFLVLLTPIFHMHIITPLKRLRRRIYSLISLYRKDLGPEDGTGNEIRSLTRAFDMLVETLDEHIEEERMAKEKLEHSNLMLRMFSGHMDSVRDEEKKAISRRVHDELGQRLLALKMSVSYIDRNIPDKNDDLDTRFKALISEIENTVAVVQSISSQLRPPVLDDLGLEAALRWRAETAFEHSDIDFTFESHIEGIKINYPIELAFFRVFSEAVANTIQHSGADKVDITIGRKDGSLNMKISDNGKGIEDGKLQRPGSFGIIGMVERMDAIGGQIDIFAEPHGGTTLIASAPLG